MLHFFPLPIHANATPEQAFMAAARETNRAEAVILAWHKDRGWTGCYVAEALHGSPPAPPMYALTRIGPWLVSAQQLPPRFMTIVDRIL